jgi:hypothetical protein
MAQALWDLAILLEDGDIGDALERMREAQERLSEAMRNGASEEEIARLMQELRDATQDYLRQKSQQAQRDAGRWRAIRRTVREHADARQPGSAGHDGPHPGTDGARPLCRGEQALQEFQQMMENLQMAQRQGGQQGQSPGQEAMEGLAETLREQQGLSDQAFRDLQEQFNPNSQSGQSQQNQGRNGSQGQGESHEQGQQPGPGPG